MPVVKPMAWSVRQGDTAAATFYSAAAAYASAFALVDVGKPVRLTHPSGRTLLLAELVDTVAHVIEDDDPEMIHITKGVVDAVLSAATRDFAEGFTAGMNWLAAVNNQRVVIVEVLS